jgi:SLT domain-containing protein
MLFFAREKWLIPRDAQRDDASKHLAKKKREASNKKETGHFLRRRSLYV